MKKQNLIQHLLIVLLLSAFLFGCGKEEVEPVTLPETILEEVVAEMQEVVEQMRIDDIEENIENARKHAIPTLSYTDEEATKMAELKNKCVDKLDTAISKIICNEAGIDTFDEAVKTAKKDGYDELKKIYQTAYDRYIPNIK